MMITMKPGCFSGNKTALLFLSVRACDAIPVHQTLLRSYSAAAIFLGLEIDLTSNTLNLNVYSCSTSHFNVIFGIEPIRIEWPWSLTSTKYGDFDHKTDMHPLLIEKWKGHKLLSW